jgi:two-component system chemotaxis sensor kinase CheA
MFMTVKRHEREKQEAAGFSNRLSEAILQSSPLGLFLIDAAGGIQEQVSRSLSTLLRRDSFAGLTLDKLLAGLCSPRTLAEARPYLKTLLEGSVDSDEINPLRNVEIKQQNADGSFDAAQYCFEFTALRNPIEPRLWLVRVTDVSERVQSQRELEDLRSQTNVQAEIVRCLVKSGNAQFAAFLARTDASMKTIDTVLKKPAREAQAFRTKLEDTLREVDGVRNDAATFGFAALEVGARNFENSLQRLRARDSLSGSDFLPLAVKLDQLHERFAELRSLSVKSPPPAPPVAPAVQPRLKVPSANAAALEDTPAHMTTQIMDAPPFAKQALQTMAMNARRATSAGTLDATLATLTDLVAQEQRKTVVLECIGLEAVPAPYQGTVKNIAIQLIRNAVMHGIEAPEERGEARKLPHGTLSLEFRHAAEGGYELLFQDDGRGLDPDKVRRVAVAKGIVSEEAASRMRDRQAIKLIFKSGFTTLASSTGEATHGTGMSLVRRYIHEAGGKIALASLLGHETRFKVSLPEPGSSTESRVA